MRPRAVVLAAAMIAVTGACTSETAETTTTTAVSPPSTAASSTTTALTTTVAIPDAGTTCVALAEAIDDLASALERGSAELADEPGPDLLVDVVARAIDFAADIDGIAAAAPTEVASELETLASAFEPWREVLDLPADEVPDRIGEQDPTALTTGRVLDAARTLADWTERECGERRQLDPDALFSIAVFDGFTAAYGGQLGDVSGEVAYGQNAELDELYELCGTGDVFSCDELYFGTLSGEYTLWGLTCGASIPLRGYGFRDCGRKLDLAGPNTYGDDPELDGLWDRCSAEDPIACDDLYALSPQESEYEARALTCGDSRPTDPRPCAFTASDEPWTYGDDAEFDALWDACSVGDGIACVDLYFDTPFDSVYEALGDHCGAMVESGYTCETIAAWLDVPVG